MAKTNTENNRESFGSNTADVNSFLVPSDENLELDLISALINDPKYMDDVYYNIKVGDFTNEAAAKVYKKLRKFYEDGESWNMTTVSAAFDFEDGVSSAIYRVPGDFLMRVSKEMIKSLKSKAIGRILFVELWNLMKKNSETDDRSEVVSKGLSMFSTLSQRLSFDADTKQSVALKHKKLMKRRLAGEIIGIPTGFPDLDFQLGQGFQKKDLIIIGARPSVGKTSFSLSLAHNMALKGAKVLYFTLEMDDEEVMDRLLSFQLGSPVQSIVRGKIPKEKLKDAYAKLDKLHLTIKYMPKATSADIFSIAAKEKTINGIDVIIVDYLGLLSDEGEKRESEVSRIGRVTKGLRGVAQMLDTAMIVPHQLNRRIEHRSAASQEDPMLSDLRDSGHIEQDADVIMFLSRDIIGSKKERAVLKIGKHRTGQTGKIDLRFNPLTTKFESV